MTSSNSELNDCLQKYLTENYPINEMFNFHIRLELFIRFERIYRWEIYMF